jgi:hypothetical protein
MKGDSTSERVNGDFSLGGDYVCGCETRGNKEGGSFKILLKVSGQMHFLCTTFHVSFLRKFYCSMRSLLFGV